MVNILVGLIGSTFFITFAEACAKRNGEGAIGNLEILIYAPGSKFDRAISGAYSAGNPFVYDEFLNNIACAKETAISPHPFQIPINKGATGLPSNITELQCGQPCSSDADCATNGCTCLATPVGNPQDRLWTSTCRLPYTASSSATKSSSGGAKISSFAVEVLNSTQSSNFSTIIRALDLRDVACPCNCTYISKACCGSASGVVYETPNLQRGNLEAPAGQYCDLTTGKLELLLEH